MKNALVASLLTALLPPIASAQETIATEDMKKKVLDETAPAEEGWTAKAKLGATFSMNHNANVVGTEDGLTLQLGGLLTAEANYRSGQHRVENRLSLQEIQTRTPQLERFVKSLDQLDVTSTYTFRFLEPQWLGLFATALLNTQIFEGEIVASQEVQVVDAEGVELATLGLGESFLLTRPFEPLNLRQTVGVFAEPVREPALKLGFKLGAGAQQILGQGGRTVLRTEENGARAVVQPLEDAVVELGAEAQVDLTGDIVDQVLSYYLSANVFYPPFTTSEIDRDFGESINLRLKAGASLKMTKVLSVDYVLTVLRIPAVTLEYQVQNGLLISAAFDLI